MSESKCDKNEVNVTHHDLEEWFKNMFEKLGWIMLASSYEYPTYSEKIEMYESNINYFIECAINKKNVQTMKIKKII